MKKLLITAFALVLAFCAFDASAKDKKDGNQQRPTREQLTVKQADYIADRLALDPDKRQKFVATFTQCQNEIFALAPEQKPGKAKTNEEAKAAAQQRFERSRKILEIRERCYNQYSTFLTPLQIEEVYRLEKKAMDKFKHHKSQHPQKSGQKGQKPGQKPGQKSGQKSQGAQKPQPAQQLK